MTGVYRRGKFSGAILLFTVFLCCSLIPASSVTVPIYKKADGLTFMYWSSQLSTSSGHSGVLRLDRFPPDVRYLNRLVFNA